jgi:hypothetical protein
LGEATTTTQQRMQNVHPHAQLKLKPKTQNSAALGALNKM